jgi:heat shock protein HslJ
MRRPALIAALALTAYVTPALSADPLLRGPWQLTGIDGAPFPVFATLWFDETGNAGGQAPCNSFTARNGASLPDLELTEITATEMACDTLAHEIRFFSALEAMRTVTLQNPDRLLLEGSDGQTMAFQRLIVIQDN